MAKEQKGNNGGTLFTWERGESGNLSGRPRRTLKQLEEMAGVEFRVSLSKEDKFDILESMLEMNLEDLKNIILDKSCPVFMVSVAKAIIGDIKHDKISTISELFDRFFGRSKQSTDITTLGKSLVSDIDYDKLSDAALIEIAKAKKVKADAE